MDTLSEKIYERLKDRTEPVTVGWLCDQLFVTGKQVSSVVKDDERYLRLNKGLILKKNYKRNHMKLY